MTEQATEYTVPKAQAQIDALLAESFQVADVQACWQCGAMVAHPGSAHTVCHPCEQGNRGNWVPLPVTVRPRAALFDWEGQCQRYATDLATLNAWQVRAKGVLAQLRPFVDLRGQAAIDALLAER